MSEKHYCIPGIGETTLQSIAIVVGPNNLDVVEYCTKIVCRHHKSPGGHLGPGNQITVQEVETDDKFRVKSCQPRQVVVK